MIEKMREALLEIERKENKTDSLRVESSLIHSYISYFEWEQLTSEEKQDKRKKVLKSLKRYKEEDGLETYHYENALIKLYDIFLFLKKDLENFEIKNVLLLRLQVLIFLDMKKVDDRPFFARKKIIPTFVYEELIKNIKSSGINLEKLDSLIDTIKMVHEHMPED